MVSHLTSPHAARLHHLARSEWPTARTHSPPPFFANAHMGSSSSKGPAFLPTASAKSMEHAGFASSPTQALHIGVERHADFTRRGECTGSGLLVTAQPPLSDLQVTSHFHFAAHAASFGAGLIALGLMPNPSSRDDAAAGFVTVGIQLSLKDVHGTHATVVDEFAAVHGCLARQWVVVGLPVTPQTPALREDCQATDAELDTIMTRTKTSVVVVTVDIARRILAARCGSVDGGASAAGTGAGLGVGGERSDIGGSDLFGIITTIVVPGGGELLTAADRDRAASEGVILVSMREVHAAATRLGPAHDLQQLPAAPSPETPALWMFPSINERVGFGYDNDKAKIPIVPEGKNDACVGTPPAQLPPLLSLMDDPASRLEALHTHADIANTAQLWLTAQPELCLCACDTILTDVGAIAAIPVTVAAMQRGAAIAVARAAPAVATPFKALILAVKPTVLAVSAAWVTVASRAIAIAVQTLTDRGGLKGTVLTKALTSLSEDQRRGLPSQGHYSQMLTKSALFKGRAVSVIAGRTSPGAEATLRMFWGQPPMVHVFDSALRVDDSPSAAPLSANGLLLSPPKRPCLPDDGTKAKISCDVAPVVPSAPLAPKPDNSGAGTASGAGADTAVSTDGIAPHTEYVMKDGGGDELPPPDAAGFGDF